MAGYYDLLETISTKMDVALTEIARKELDEFAEDLWFDIDFKKMHVYLTTSKERITDIHSRNILEMLDHAAEECEDDRTLLKVACWLELCASKMRKRVKS